MGANMSTYSWKVAAFFLPFILGSLRVGHRSGAQAFQGWGAALERQEAALKFVAVKLWTAAIKGRLEKGPFSWARPPWVGTQPAHHC